MGLVPGFPTQSGSSRVGRSGPRGLYPGEGYKESAMANRGRHRLSVDNVQKIVALLLSGTELVVQVIEVISHVH